MYSRSYGAEEDIVKSIKVFKDDTTADSLRQLIADKLKSAKNKWQNGAKITGENVIVQTNLICGFSNFESVWFKVYVTQKNNRLHICMQVNHMSYTKVPKDKRITASEEHVNAVFNEFTQLVKKAISLAQK